MNFEIGWRRKGHFNISKWMYWKMKCHHFYYNIESDLATSVKENHTVEDHLDHLYRSWWYDQFVPWKRTCRWNINLHPYSFLFSDMYTSFMFTTKLVQTHYHIFPMEINFWLWFKFQLHSKPKINLKRNCFNLDWRLKRQ